MNKKIDFSKKFKHYKQSVLYGIILLGTIILLIVAIILPYNHSISKLDGRIKDLKDKLSAQELQAPLYANLNGQLKKNTIEGITLNDEEKLDRDDIFEISDIIRGHAEDNNLVYTKSDPDINSMEKYEGLISVDLIVEGMLTDFRKFINSLNEVPYLQDIEELEISSAETNRIYQLQIWLAIE